MRPFLHRRIENRRFPHATGTAFWRQLTKARLFWIPIAFGLGAANGADIYWDGSTANWSSTSSWSTASGATTPNPSAVPGSSDNAIFNISTANSNNTVSLAGNQAALSLLFKSTGTTTIRGNSSGSTARTLTVGTGGITLNAGTGAVTFNNANGTITVYLNGSQTWANNSSSLLSIASNISNVANLSPYTLTLTGSGTGGTTLSGVISDGGTTGTTAVTVNRTGSGAVTLSGANTYTGATTLTAGTLTLGNANALQNSTLAMNGGTLSFGTQTAVTTGGLSGSGNIALTNTTPAAVALTTGGNNASTTYSGILSGSGSLTKNGSGTLTLSGANTFSGNTTLSAGTLTIGNTSALQNSTLSMNGGALSFGTQTAATIGALSGSGNIALTNTTPAAVALTAGGNNASTTYSGILSGSGSLTKTGTGALTLSSANTFSGTTTLSAGTLTLGNTNAIQNSTLSMSGGTLSFGTQTSATIGGLSGSGNIALANTTPAAVALTAGGNNASTSYSGILSGSGSLTKSGSGTLTLSNANTYTGATTISAGTLALSGSGSIADSSGVANNATFDISATTSGTSIKTLSGSGNTTLGSKTLTLTNASSTYSGVISGTGGLNLTAGSETFTGANTFSGAINLSSGTTLTGTNSAVNNVYNPGNPQSIGGFNALGLRNGLVSDTTVITVASGATLAVSSSLTGGTAGTETQQYMTMSLNGTGSGGNGALVATGGNNTWLGNITLAGNTTIGNTAATGDNNLLFLGPYVNYAPTTFKLNNNTATFGGTGDIYIASTVGASGGDTGSVLLNGTGTVYFAGNRNYYTGTTTVNSGTLVLSLHDPVTTTNVGILGNLTIGDGTGAANSAVVIGKRSDQISDSVTVTINSDGLLDLASYSRAETIGTLNLNGGRTSSGTGMLYLNSAVNVTANSIMDGRITFNNTNAVTVSGSNSLTVNAWIASGAFSKEGTGTMVLTNDNYNSNNGYLGTTTVNNGVLSITNGGALGLYVGGDVSAGTAVNSGGTLRLDGTSSNIAVVGERLTIEGTGYSSNGALNSLTGTNSWAGPIYIKEGATGGTIKTDAGTLTLSGVVTGSATTGNTQTLTFDGAGNTDVTGVITDNRNTVSPYNDLHIGTLALTKNGTGTVTLSNAGGDTFTGAIAINNGTLAVSNNNVLASQTNTVNVASSGTFSLYGGSSYTNTISKLTGSGLVSIAASTTLVVNNSVADTFDGRLTGSGLFEKQGHGTFTFSSTANTSAFNFAGEVKLTATATTDTLEFQGGSGVINTSTNALYIGTLTLTGGTLLLTNSYINVGTLQITGDTILDFGTTGHSILNANNIYIAAGVTLLVKNWDSEVDFLFANSSFRVDNSGGQLSIRNQIGTDPTKAPENQVWFQGDPQSPDGSHTTWIDNSNTYTAYTNWEIRPVPEPSTYGAILLGGCFGLLAWRRLRRTAAKR